MTDTRVALYDAHCHATDTVDCLSALDRMRAGGLCIMSTRAENQRVVAETAEKYGNEQRFKIKIVPAFGWHPWFSYLVNDNLDDVSDWSSVSSASKDSHYTRVLTPLPDSDISSLPDPIPLSNVLTDLYHHLKEHPSAMVGEIGLDRSFRVPAVSTSLSKWHVNIEHQKKLFAAQLRMAAELQRPVSVHAVQAHGIVFDVVQEWCEAWAKRHDNQSMPRLCLHSYTGAPELASRYLDARMQCKVYFSFSTAVNFSNSKSTGKSKAVRVIEMLPEDRILIESDLHAAGEEMDQELENVLELVCAAREWAPDIARQQLKLNWEEFVFGSHVF